MTANARRNRLLDRWGWYEPRTQPMNTTTRQAEVLNIALPSPPTTHRGLIVGADRLSGQLVCHDPFVAYEDSLVSSVDVMVAGDAGQGKSSLLRTWGTIRQLVLHHRRVVVLDSKPGEYAAVADAVGAPTIRFAVDGTASRLNLLDPAIRLGADQSDVDTNAPAGQLLLLRAVLADALGRAVSQREGKALRLALLAATADARNRGRVPVIGDVVHHLLHPDARAAAELDVPANTVRDWGWDPAFALERIGLAGPAGGETTPDVRLDHPSGLTRFDLSGLPDGPARRVLTTVITTWQANLPAGPEQTVIIVDECGQMTTGALGKLFQRTTKPARATMAVCHRVTGLPALRQAGTVFIYRQASRGDAEACVALYDLPPSATQVIMNLEPGTCLLKIGAGPPLIVRHLRTLDEIRLTETPGAPHRFAGHNN
jgi:hypothetical protein